MFGSRNVFRNTGEVVQSICPRCNQLANFQGKSYRTWFTLFFIPIFPVSGQKTFCECSNCRGQFKLTLEQLKARLQQSQQASMQQSIQMYNSLRASPANSVTLNNLMLLYLQLHEYDQAISAANEFQTALNASEQCMSTLGRVLIEQKRFPEAIRWFDAALARNSTLGEAAYCKAIAMMSLQPPDLAGAAAAGRMARTAGFPGADGLLREIDNRSRVS